jgi:hypothetical protein
MPRDPAEGNGNNYCNTLRCLSRYCRQKSLEHSAYSITSLVENSERTRIPNITRRLCIPQTKADTRRKHSTVEGEKGPIECIVSKLIKSLPVIRPPTIRSPK